MHPSLISRLAGVGFSVAFAIELLPPGCGCDGENDGEAFDPAEYDWSLIGKAAGSDPETTARAFELTTANGRITIDEGQVLCTFAPSDTEALNGAYRAQLIGTKDGVDDLGAEVDPFQFAVRF